MFIVVKSRFIFYIFIIYHVVTDIFKDQKKRKRKL